MPRLRGGRAGADSSRTAPSPAPVRGAQCTIASLAAFGLVYGLAWRRGLDADWLVLVGIGVWYGSVSLSTFLLVRSNPWDTPRIYTWLSGSTYGRSWDQVAPVAIALLIVFPAGAGAAAGPAVRGGSHRYGSRRRRSGRPAHRPSTRRGTQRPRGACRGARRRAAARRRRHHGRTLMDPAQVPAGLVVALIGAPFFVFLLARSRV